MEEIAGAFADYAEDVLVGPCRSFGLFGLAPLAGAVVWKAERVHSYGTAIDAQAAFAAGKTGVIGFAGRHRGQVKKLAA